MNGKERDKIDLIYDMVKTVDVKIDDIKKHNAQQDVLIQKSLDNSLSVRKDFNKHEKSHTRNVALIISVCTAISGGLGTLITWFTFFRKG